MSTRPGLPKLVATDLDGTLVRSDDTVSAYTHEVLARVKAAGIPLVGATGRGPRLIDTCRSRMTLVAKLPSVTTTRGRTQSRVPDRYGRHASISSGSGSRLPGGRHRTTFVM